MRRKKRRYNQEPSPDDIRQPLMPREPHVGIPALMVGLCEPEDEVGVLLETTGRATPVRHVTTNGQDN